VLFWVTGDDWTWVRIWDLGLYWRNEKANELTVCRNLLGRPFLENVVAVHDVGAKEMRFAMRKYNNATAQE
jgi:hypothetical protein